MCVGGELMSFNHSIPLLSLTKNVSQVRLVLVILYNDISILDGYLMPGTVYTHDFK